MMPPLFTAESPRTVSVCVPARLRDNGRTRIGLVGRLQVACSRVTGQPTAGRSLRASLSFSPSTRERISIRAGGGLQLAPPLCSWGCLGPSTRDLGPLTRRLPTCLRRCRWRQYSMGKRGCQRRIIVDCVRIWGARRGEAFPVSYFVNGAVSSRQNVRVIEARIWECLSPISRKFAPKIEHTLIVGKHVNSCHCIWHVSSG